MYSSADDFLRPEMESRGYKGAFMAKCSSTAESYGYPSDGCAIFYRTERFQAVDGPAGQPVTAVSDDCPHCDDSHTLMTLH